ncbi:hypothetical protein AYL99_08308 [Fonsecaea erecta]|uniref:Succinate dehydrogenase assembly factor 4, mitochondrial n=1 Tax=Fonsecaea erecta TaxID=1367422 RepID=A0A178ZCQ0_9EURO|nr:hypothetical protein AYL99_08308 [Fonsecaea erecta]OAP57570.1 hypothetical protein AYL99_08308 [Fonsecaea erecta]
MKRATTLPVHPPSLCAAPRAHLFTGPRPISVSSSSSSSSSHVHPCSCARTGLTRSHARQLSHSARLRKDEPSSSGGASPFSFRGMPAPPRLPKEEQEIFEALQRQSTGAFSTPRTERTPPRINQSPDSSASERDDAQAMISQRVYRIASSVVDDGGVEGHTAPQDSYDHVIDASGAGEELHPNLVRGAQPEFEGERNPKTGEIGGPKNEPLRWGPSGEWTYNGRATDF